MRRVLQTILNAATILSALLLALTAALWARSYFYVDVVRLLLDEHNSVSFTSGGGVASFGREDEGLNRDVLYSSQPISSQYRRLWTLEWSRTERTWGQSRHVAYPYILLLFGALPLLRLFRRASPKLGICASCGYDLRATPDRCPECGAVPRTKTARLPKSDS